MLTVCLLLSGPHRLGMLDTAFSSIPLDSPAVSQVLVRHQGGPWTWGGELRERIIAHPKVRVVEFTDRAEDYAHSFNRTLDLVETPWGLLLPDDDFLIRPAAKAGFEAAIAHPSAEECGMVAFGWYLFREHRYLATSWKPSGLKSLVSHTPKFCSTMLNMRRFREVGGFPSMGGFCDTALYGRLAYEYDALYTDSPVGVYRMHDGQESARMRTVYAPFVEALSSSLSRYARNPFERLAFRRKLASFTHPHTGSQLIEDLSFWLRARHCPIDQNWQFAMRKWSEG